MKSFFVIFSMRFAVRISNGCWSKSKVPFCSIISQHFNKISKSHWTIAVIDPGRDVSSTLFLHVTPSKIDSRNSSSAMMQKVFSKES